MDCAIVVPARLGSQRFPKKLLQPVLGRPLISWTAENLLRIAPEVPLYFAVAEEELADVLGRSGLSCIMTDPDLPSGTDRIAVANQQINAQWIINVQADEPILSAEHISCLFDLLAGGADMATLATPFLNEPDFKDPNKVKVVTTGDGTALYFSRAPIPFDRNSGGALPQRAYWHMGVYAYTSEVLERFLNWTPSPLEQIEKLEQLRILENGQRIGVAITDQRTIGVDAPSDLEALEAHLRGV